MNYRSEAITSLLKSTSQPLVVLDLELRGVAADVVLTDQAPGIEGAVAHVASLGHKRVAILSFSRSVRSGRELHAGFEAVSKRLGITMIVQAIIPFDGIIPRTGWTMTERAVGAGATAISSLTAVPVTIGALQDRKEQGIRVRNDVSLIVYDYEELGLVMEPSPSGIVRPVEECAWRVSRLFIGRSANWNASRRVEVAKTRFLTRVSAGTCPRTKQALRGLTLSRRSEPAGQSSVQ